MLRTPGTEPRRRRSVVLCVSAAWNRTVTLCIHFVANFFVYVTNVRGTAIAVATLLLVAFRLDVVVVVVDSRNPSIATCRGSFCLTFVFEQF